MEKIELQKCKRMADEIDRVFPLEKSVKEAIASVKRELFVPAGFKHFAYKLDALPLSSNQWISSPLTVAKMTQALMIDKSVDSVLEIGCGSGYQAAILSRLIRRVFSIERIEKLSKEAKERFKKLGFHNINVRCDDGQNGWSSFAPYDRILFSAAAKEIPSKIFDQLKDGGILVAPIDTKDRHIITRFTKDGPKIKKEELQECLFVPILSGTEK
ncbi:MAG: protein-L-isoaspartate(D-aspartate) O-methyltransferase [Epsilonproteobacteria bacterium]|nr:protein-L-isoaspartate(D-aspartate) O-methyltransferase [Campylobacterota bacterium]